MDTPTRKCLTHPSYSRRLCAWFSCWLVRSIALIPPHSTTKRVFKKTHFSLSHGLETFCAVLKVHHGGQQFPVFSSNKWISPQIRSHIPRNHVLMKADTCWQTQLCWSHCKISKLTSLQRFNPPHQVRPDDRFRYGIRLRKHVGGVSWIGAIVALYNMYLYREACHISFKLWCVLAHHLRHYMSFTGKMLWIQSVYGRLDAAPCETRVRLLGKHSQ